MKHLLVVCDSLRPDHLSAYGHHRRTSPNIDEVASDGIRFTRAHSQAYWTGPSSGSIVTGRYPLSNPIGYNNTRSDPKTTIGNELMDAGYTTASVGGSDLTALQSKANGFEESMILTNDYGPDDPAIAVATADEAIAWIGDHDDADEDWLLLIWNMGTHTPFEQPDEYERAYSDGLNGDISSLKAYSLEHADAVRDLYDDAIRHTDQELGRVFDAMRSADIYDDSTITITADHGEVFSQHSREECFHYGLRHLLKLLPKDLRIQQSFGDRSGYVGHQQLLPYDELLNVPLIMKLPGNEFGGTRQDGLAQLIDLAPTLLDIESTFGDQDFVPSDAFQGSSLLPMVQNGVAVNEFVYSSTPVLFSLFTYHSVFNGKHKYVTQTFDRTRYRRLRDHPRRTIIALIAGFATDWDIGFDVQEGETVDIIERRSMTFDRLREEFENWEYNSENHTAVDRNVEPDMNKEQLRDLGYL